MLHFCQTSISRFSEIRINYIGVSELLLPWWFNGKEPTGNAGDQVRSPSWEDPQEKEMATYSSILTWRTPWTEEPGGLQSMGSQKVGHDLGWAWWTDGSWGWIVFSFEYCWCCFTISFSGCSRKPSFSFKLSVTQINLLNSDFVN